jgi:hypothetical protein
MQWREQGKERAREVRRGEHANGSTVACHDETTSVLRAAMDMVAMHWGVDFLVQDVSPNSYPVPAEVG